MDSTRSRSSLMIRGTRAARQAASSACACLPRSVASADLFRYWSTHAPPASAMRALRTRPAVSASSGVIAYRPRTGARCSALSRAGFIHLPRPEESIRDELPHARAKARVQRLPGVFLGLAHGIGQLEAVGERRRDRGGQRASRAVVGLWKPFPAVGAHHALRAIERVHHLRSVLVRACDEHILAAEADELFGGAGERHLVVVVAVRKDEASRLAAVRREDGRLG